MTRVELPFDSDVHCPEGAPEGVEAYLVQI